MDKLAGETDRSQEKIRPELNLKSANKFHTQPVFSCYCGPSITLVNSKGGVIKEEWQAFFWQKMQQGNIFAVKGLGGFHLICILNQEVIAKLRHRKKRPFKPFVIMCRDLETVYKYCHLDLAAEELLLSQAAPVVVLPVKNSGLLPSNINPHLQTLGVMLPYTALHHLLLQGPFDSMICTSANPTNLPIIKENAEAVGVLGEIVDYYLLHDGNILQRSDDSVTKIAYGKPQFIRRSRGYVPKPLPLGFAADKVVLGAGAEMKNTFCLLKGQQAVPSQHLGEMGTLEAASNYRETLHRFLGLFDLQPEIVGYDPHPGYMVSSQARQLPACKYYAIQHHHAHFASCLAENRFNAEDAAIGIILDGTGYGLDGAVWGCEILSGGLPNFRREYHLDYVYLPGGESASRWPWRSAVSFLFQSMGESGLSVAERLFGKLYSDELKIVSLALQQRQYLLPYSSCGRLFDAVAALLGLCYENTYEGQAAIQLGEILVNQEMVDEPLDGYDFYLKNKTIDFSPLFPAIIDDLRKKTAVDIIARRFHDTLVRALVEAVRRVSEETGLHTVALSGGSWHNDYLLNKTVSELKKMKLHVLLQRQVPPNDGGLSLGQAAVAYWRWKEDVPGNSDEDY